MYVGFVSVLHERIILLHFTQHHVAFYSPSVHFPGITQ